MSGISMLSGIVNAYPILILLILPVASLLLWYRIRSSAFRLSKQRTQRLYALAKKGNSDNVDPLVLQVAVSDALRSTIDDRWIKAAFARHNPIRMLADCKFAKGIVRLTDTGDGFVDARRYPFPSLRMTGWVLYLISISPWILLGFVSIGASASAPLLLALVIVGVIYTPVFTWLGICVEAARRLVERIDDCYPIRGRYLPVSQGVKSARVDATEDAGGKLASKSSKEGKVPRTMSNVN